MKTKNRGEKAEALAGIGSRSACCSLPGGSAGGGGGSMVLMMITEVVWCRW